MTTSDVETPVAPVKSISEIASVPHRAKVPTVLQQAAVECGAASLGMVLASMGRWELLSTLREQCGVNRDGASAVQIVTAASEYGLEYEARRGDATDLDGIAVPAIIWWHRSHFMVLEGFHGGKFYVNDPARGQYAVDADDFVAGYSGAALTFTKTAEFKTGGHKFRVTPALMRRLTNSKLGVNFAIIAGVLAMLLGLVSAPVASIFINEVLGQNANGVLIPLIITLLAIGIFRAGLTMLEYGVISRLQAKLTLVGDAGFIATLMRMPMTFFLERSIGDLSQRVSYNASVASLLASQMASAGIALLGAIGYAALLLYYNIWIGSVVIILSLLNVVVLRMVMNKRTTIQGRVVRRQNQLRGTTTQAIQGIETIKATGMEDDMFKSLTGQQADYISASAALVPSSSLLVAVPVFLFSLTSASILVLGGYFTITGSFTLGALLAVQALAVNLNSPIQTLMSTGSQLQVITSSLNSLDDVLANGESERFNRSALRPGDSFAQLSGRITLKDVSFGYGDKAPLVLDSFSLELEPGKRIALVGGSGAGKTTIGNLASGLYLPRSGEVLYDGKPMSEYPIGVIERLLSKVDQSIVLFEGTVRENVTLWDTTVPEEDIRRALADAQILDDVLAREGGIDCTLEENGRNFSGGQCQRIEIARALVLNPRAIILDEATSALDDITEKNVDDALRRRGVACLIIAHRLSTIRDADEIIVLGRGGKVLERGSQDSLMALNGTYAAMVNAAGEGGDVGV
jgi:NHLM bacteriocin system ABC transporter peptidase/ATP-binding protein